jgi:hypothetical protein
VGDVHRVQSVFALFSQTETAMSISVLLNVSNPLEYCLEMSILFQP